MSQKRKIFVERAVTEFDPTPDKWWESPGDVETTTIVNQPPHRRGGQCRGCWRFYDVPEPPQEGLIAQWDASDAEWRSSPTVTGRWISGESGVERAPFRPQHAWRWISHVMDYDARRAAYRVGVRVEVYQGTDPQRHGQWTAVECSFSLAREWLEDQVQPGGHTIEQALWPMVNEEVNEWVRRL